MTGHGLTPMMRLEVIVEGETVPLVRDLFEESGVTGWTGVSNVSGLGHGGFHQGGLLFNDRDALSILMTVVPADRIDALVAGVRELLADRSGVMFVSETFVSRPEYFQ